MGFVLLHDKYGDALFIAKDLIISAELQMYGTKRLTKVLVNHNIKDERNVFYVVETVTEIYDLINNSSEKPRNENECT